MPRLVSAARGKPAASFCFCLGGEDEGAVILGVETGPTSQGGSACLQRLENEATMFPGKCFNYGGATGRGKHLS